METLPDLLKEGLDIVFVGINPSVYSARAGHYFANPRNRFWRAFNAAGLAPEPLGPQDDARCLELGIGFTDLVKRPTPSAAELLAAEVREGARALHEKLLRFQPLIACFQGVTCFRNYARNAGGPAGAVAPGRQPALIGHRAPSWRPAPARATPQCHWKTSLISMRSSNAGGRS